MNKIIHSPLCISYFSGCQLYGFVSTVAALAEIWSLAAVSCDRLQAILYPLDKHKRITKLQVFYEYTFVYDVIEKSLKFLAYTLFKATLLIFRQMS